MSRRPTQAHISVPALENNLSLIRSLTPSQIRVMAVVKGDAYGHTAALCLPVFQRAGVEVLGVATVNEAIELRALGATERIALLTTPFESERDAFVDLELEPFISDRQTAEWLSATAARVGRKVRGHIYMDTGMTRNGVSPSEVVALTEVVSKLPGIEIQGFGSHLATSDDAQSIHCIRQIEVFEQAYRSLLDHGFQFEDVHIANSGGILNFPASHFSMVRPGLALYGYHPDPKEQGESGLLPVMSIRTAISSIRGVPEGTGVSYGRRFVTDRDTLIATIPIGYGDGLFRGLTGRLDVLIAGERYPVVGTICMDEVMIDLGPESTIAVGEEVILIGRSGEQSIDGWHMAAQVGTIPYEITTAIAPRVPRVPVQQTDRVPITDQT